MYGDVLWIMVSFETGGLKKRERGRVGDIGRSTGGGGE